MAAPLHPADAAGLAFSAEVARLRTSEHRRLFPLALQVGEPAGSRRRLEVPWPAPADIDQGLRFDLADALLGELVGALARTAAGPETRAAWGWVARPGVPQVHDCDLEWFAALARAAGSHDVSLRGFRAVTRTGWLDVVSGESRAWKRPRR